ncbi:UDP-N-acetyl-2-amino-2-deoxyglucuronate dehydrogenase [Sediminibacterium magnilacihabitans]|nr:UDP-N-acetyl-2-amino-2-deoxyglucuronate dehydrogenase [Sediminibacterium magnilacihabitans]
MSKRFALIGAAGYIAPRHMKAIKDTGNTIVAALDKFDSVGILDSYFPQADFFTEFERFDRHIEKLRLSSNPIEYVSICSPNYLHDSHIRFGLRNHSDVICEKPLVLNPWNLDSLALMEKEFGRKVYNILQLRLHPAIVALQKKVQEGPADKVYDVDLTYITSRGNWYYTSWKGDVQKSGGIATNIGVHFYDMLAWIFGGVQKNIVHLHEHDRAAGFIEFAKAKVRWFLSINYGNIPQEIQESGKRTFRSLTIDGESFEFSDGFTELHTQSYQNILAGNGFSLMEAKTAIEIVHDIRTQKPLGAVGDYHPFVTIPLSQHPFNIK